MEKEAIYYSISQINEYIKVLFDNTATLKNIYLKGEISNYRGRNKAGHIYFTLKDEKCSLNAVLFKYDSFSLDFEPKNGDEVLVFGSISSYPPSGTYQIICKNISLFGIGDSYLKKELLKKKLFQEGIFNSEHKKSLPLYPSKIAVITGKNSAAALDFEFNLKRRFPLVDVIIISSLVQGENAAKDLIKNLKEALEFQEFYLEKQDADQIKLMDSRFHEILYKLSGSITFYDTLVPLHKKIQKYRRASLESKSRAAASVAEHRRIFDAVAAKDAPLAAKYASEHVENAYKHIIGKD